MISIMIDFDDKRYIYDQIYRAFRDGILCGDICGGERLPSKRSLASQLGVSINSVDTAYQILAAEGYIMSRQRSGFFACNLAPQPKVSLQKSEPATKKTPQVRKFNFTTSGIDSALFPYKLWCRIEREVLGDASLLNHGDRQGDYNLRRVVCDYLRGYRGIDCHPEEIIIGAGMDYLLCILARLFEGQTVAVENPGYGRAAKVFGDFGANTVFVPLDSEGMDVNFLRKTSADLAYITPSCQYPTGITMPVNRRHDIMSWARECSKRYIIEDDFNSEFRFSTRPIPSLKSQDGDGKVIHIGTFSKSVAPSLRIAYMLLPPTLLSEWQERFGGYSCTVSRFEQQALFRFIEKGHFQRHVNRLRITFKKRRDHLINELKRLFGKDLIISPSNSGLHILVAYNGNIEISSLLERAVANGIQLQTLGEFNLVETPNRDDRLIFGYSAMDEKRITQATELLHELWC